MRYLMLALTLLIVACQRPAAEAPAPVVARPALPPEVSRYLSLLSTVEQAKAPTSLEPLFEQVEAAQGALMQISGTGDQALLETFDEAAFIALQAQLRGLKLNRGSDIYAQPDPAFFLALAKAHGRAEDIAFFEQFAAGWGPDLVPSYLQLRAQPTPCVRFGEGLIAPRYAGWQQFIARHPAAYPHHAAQSLADLEEAVALGTCACGDLDSVRREQAEFLLQFPNSPKTSDIRARRAQLEQDPEALPIHCR